jgi:DNA (cytosine-5)-methyltransferase 1
MALVMRAGGNPGMKGKSIDEPMPTVVGNDRQLGLVVQNMNNNVPRDVDEPLPPVTTGGNHMLIRVNRGGKNGRVDNGSLPTTPEQPVPTVAGHGELAIVEMQNHGRASSAQEPIRTIYGEGYHHGLLVYNGMPGFVRSLEDAAGVVTGRDKQSLLVPYYGTGVSRQVEEPMAAITGKDRCALVVTEDDIDQCYFRMLQWPELLRAQVMHVMPDGSEYQLTARTRDRHGKMKELSNQNRVKMIGNAVSSTVATILGNAVVEALR